MIEFIDEPVTVEVQLQRDEAVRPLAFHWRGQRFVIESWGREHTTTQDNRLQFFGPHHRTHAHALSLMCAAADDIGKTDQVFPSGTNGRHIDIRTEVGF